MYFILFLLISERKLKEVIFMPIVGNEIHFKYGLQETFNDITKDINTLYFTTDTKRIYLGNNAYGSNIETGNALPLSHPAGQIFVLNSSGHYMLYFSDGINWHSLSELDEQQFDELKTELQATATSLQNTYRNSMETLSNQYTSELDNALERVNSAIENMSLVSGPFYIVDNTNNKTYNCNIVISSEGTPELLYEEFGGE